MVKEMLDGFTWTISASHQMKYLQAVSPKSEEQSQLQLLAFNCIVGVRVNALFLCINPSKCLWLHFSFLLSVQGRGSQHAAFP